MKDLLSKEHYYYKIYTLLMKSSVYRFFYRQPRLYELRPPIFTKKSWSFFLWFFKPPTPKRKEIAINREDFKQQANLSSVTVGMFR